jgi:hypothetical protein
LWDDDGVVLVVEGGAIARGEIEEDLHTKFHYIACQLSEELSSTM